MELSPLINEFKKQEHLHNKMVAVVGDAAYEIEDMEAAIEMGFESDNLVFGASGVAGESWEYAHIEQNEDGRYMVSSDMPHTGIKDVEAADVPNAMKAVSDILTALLDTSASDDACQ